MPFKMGGVEWRYDTLINTVILAAVAAFCTHVLVHRMALTALEDQVQVQRLAAVSTSLEDEVKHQSDVMGQMAFVRTEHAKMLKQSQANWVEIKKLEAQLQAEQRIR